MTAILITQCLQNDFIRPLDDGEPIPNLVHVGTLESARLAGRNGTLVPFLERAHGIDPAQLAIVHIVDDHDPVEHAAHFDLFRPHCISGSEGARLIDSIEDRARTRDNTYFVRAGDLNDFEDSNLPDVLEDLGAGDPGDLRIATIGVWTDAKVLFLLYDLVTRLGARNLAVCSALTASRSMRAHFYALEHLETVLGVRVFHAPTSLLEWLVDDECTPPVKAADTNLVFEESASTPLDWNMERIDEMDALLTHLAGGAKELRLAPLGGGYSGAQVFIARSGRGVIRVIKVGDRDEIAQERFGNELVRQILGATVPALHTIIEGQALAGMKVELAESLDPEVTGPHTFESVYMEDKSESAGTLLESTLRSALYDAMGRLYRFAEKATGDLLEIYSFKDHRGVPQHVEGIDNASDAIAAANGFNSAEALLEETGLGRPWKSPSDFYRQWLPTHTVTREFPISPVHGDLNLQNILITRRPDAERPERIWIIDFARVSRMPVLTDFAKIENDLSFILFRIPDDEALRRAEQIQEARLASPTLAVPGLEDLARTDEERRYISMLTILRSIAEEMDDRGDVAVAEYRLALLRYAAHTLAFDQPDATQLRMALLASARLSGLVARDHR